MYEYNIRKMFRELYAIFFNSGTAHVLSSLKISNDDTLRIASKDDIENLNTLCCYLIMFVIIAGKLARLNYSCLYKFFGSRSSLIIKDRTKLALGVYIENKNMETKSFGVAKKFLCLDFVRVLELFRVERNKIEEILKNRDFDAMLKSLKNEIFVLKYE